MKFVEPRRFTDPEAAAGKLVDIANAIEPAQDGRIYIELVNGRFLKEDGTPDNSAPASRKRSHPAGSGGTNPGPM